MKNEDAFIDKIGDDPGLQVGDFKNLAVLGLHFFQIELLVSLNDQQRLGGAGFKQAVIDRQGW